MPPVTVMKNCLSLLPLALIAPLVAAPAFAQAPLPPSQRTDDAPAPAPPPAPPADAPAAPAEAPPPVPNHPQPWITAEFSTLRLLREKHVLSQAEYDSALRDLVDTSGNRSGDTTTFAVGKFATTLYGFTEFDSIWDSTQSFNDTAGNAQVARPGTYAGGNTRVQFGMRNSRFGIRVKSPETRWFRASGVVEMDFEGATLPIGSGQPYYGTEAAYFNNPTFRLRHAYGKFETPVVDLLFGQTWHLFGWGTLAFPTTVGIQGYPAELYSRNTQFRASHTFKGEYVELEIALAALRPPQRNSGTPDGAGGLKLAFPKWTGMQTVNSTGTSVTPLTIGVSGDVRRVDVNDWSAAPTHANAQTGGGIAVDAFVPIIPATHDHKGNSLSINGEFVYGSGIADLYTSMTGGVPFAPALPNPTMAATAPVYTPDIDQGIASYTVTNGKATLNLVQWTTLNFGAAYYFPGLDGRLFVAGNYGRSMSNNAKDLLGVADPTLAASTKAVATARTKIRDHEEWFDFNVMGDPYPGVRMGVEYVHFADTYLDGTLAVNHRVQFSAFYIF
jgi:hypothetical protein